MLVYVLSVIHRLRYDLCLVNRFKYKICAGIVDQKEKYLCRSHDKPLFMRAYCTSKLEPERRPPGSPRSSIPPSFLAKIISQLCRRFAVKRAARGVSPAPESLFPRKSSKPSWADLDQWCVADGGSLPGEPACGLCDVQPSGQPAEAPLLSALALEIKISSAKAGPVT
jgi:hypothetical protein